MFRVTVIALILAAAALPPGCGGHRSPAPTAPSQAATLSIDGLDSALIVGAQVQVSATLHQGGSVQSRVQVAWTTSAPDVITIGPDGVLMARSPGFASISGVTPDGVRAELRVEVVPGVAGAWTGQFKITTCDRLEGNAPNPCRFTVNSVHPIALDLQQRGKTVTGTAVLYQTSYKGTVAGDIDSSSTLHLAGSVFLGTDRSDLDWQLRVGEDAISADTLILKSVLTNAFGPQVLVEGCQLMALARGQDGLHSGKRTSP